MCSQVPLSRLSRRLPLSTGSQRDETFNRRSEILVLWLYGAEHRLELLTIEV
jgi:hypothetical protein